MPRRQCHEIEKQQQDAPARRRLLQLIRDRHHETGSYFEIEPVSGREVLLVPSELLARSAAVADPAAAGTIAAAGFTAEPIAGLDGRVVRIHRPGSDREEVAGLQQTLADQGVGASLAYVTPTKIIMKAEATPERARDGGRRPERSIATTRSTVPVVILDTGVARCERTDGWLDGLETPANRDPLDVFPEPNGRLDFAAGHGTFIAGLYEQADPGLEVRVRRVLDTDGIVSEVDVACALVDCVRDVLQHGGKLVVNLSLGTDTVDDRPPLALSAALEIVREVEAERDAEVLLVAAAGNDGSAEPCWPAAFAETDPHVVAVAALDPTHQPSGWSTRGSWVTCSAVGEDVVSTFVTGTEDPAIDPRGETFGANAWASWTGTSFAAPQVAARIAGIAQSEDVSLAVAKGRLFERAGCGHDDDFGVLLSFDS